MTLNPRWIVGKTIARVDLHTTRAREHGRRAKAHSPVITFTDGSWLTFATEETDFGFYGTDITFHKARK